MNTNLLDSPNSNSANLLINIANSRRDTVNAKVGRIRDSSNGSRIDQQKQENVLLTGRIRDKMNKYYQNFYLLWKDLSFLVAFLALLGLVLSVINYEVGYNNL